MTSRTAGPATPPARRGMTAGGEVAVSVLVGAAAAVPASMATSVPLGLLLGWDLASLVYLTWLWSTIRNRDARSTAQRATVTDPDRAVTDLLLLGAAIASLVAVGFVLVRAGQQHGTQELFRVGLGLVSVVLSWAIVHTVFTLRYAQLYYAGEDGGIDFNQPEAPTYTDFGYLAFTIGMTFQVSDTPLRSRIIRRTALRHALLSYLFGTGILATTINLVASLSSK
ncbi:MAG: DUF1345 domain-containing protein [Actinomycetota bacterium]|nr:DUF1345 domain-containing protein [Actinomycetota bacterium]